MRKPQLYNMDEDYIEDWDAKQRPDQRQPVRTKKTEYADYADYDEYDIHVRRKHPVYEEEIRVERSPKKSKKRRKKRHGLLKFLILLLVLSGIFLGGLYYGIGLVYGKMQYKEIPDVAAAPLKEDGVIHVLLIGNDSRENGEDGRSDAMILLTFNKMTKKLYLTSLLRDMYVEIPGHDGNRLNAAYAFGGPQLLMETIEKNLDISVNDYVLVNFEAFANMVDAVDGIDLEISQEEAEYINGYLVEYNMLTNQPQGTYNLENTLGGMTHLNGPQALAYSRIRYIGTDFGRTERQRKVLEAVIRKAPKALIQNPKELINGLLPNLSTNLTQKECFSLVLYFAGMLQFDMEQISIPLQGTYKDAKIRGMAVLEVDFEANKQYLKDTLYGTEPGKGEPGTE